VKLLADECFSARLVEGLRQAGHDVLSIRETSPGILDHEVLSLAVAEGRDLHTEDKDFGELVVRDSKPNHGVLLLRMEDFALALKLQRLLDVIVSHEAKLPSHLTVVDVSKVRFRPII
jgi:predicted nuclease of predicted toxin-antitoxin system